MHSQSKKWNTIGAMKKWTVDSRQCGIFFLLQFSTNSEFSWTVAIAYAWHPWYTWLVYCQYRCFCCCSIWNIEIAIFTRTPSGLLTQTNQQCRCCYKRTTGNVINEQRKKIPKKRTGNAIRNETEIKQNERRTKQLF